MSTPTDPTAGERPRCGHDMHWPSDPCNPRSATPDAGDAGEGEALAEVLSQAEHAPMSTHDPRTGECLQCPWPVHMLPPDDIAAFILASDWLAARESAAATKRVEDAAQTIVLMPPEHRPRSVVASIFTGHTLGCICEVCAFMGEEPSAAATRARAEEARAANERQRLSLDTTLNRLIAEELDAGHTERAASLRSLRAWNRGAAYVIPRGAR